MNGSILKFSIERFNPTWKLCSNLKFRSIDELEKYCMICTVRRNNKKPPFFWKRWMVEPRKFTCRYFKDQTLWVKISGKKSFLGIEWIYLSTQSEDRWWNQDTIYMINTKTEYKRLKRWHILHKIEKLNSNKFKLFKLDIPQIVDQI